ncbi:MAG TPA: hypothetical protein PKG52_08490, partial [bacterium]|nr:hypothetical protein [bacterium]
MRNNLLILLLVFGFLTCFVSCGEQEYGYEKYGKDFDNDGGTYIGVDGVTVVIPPGALPDGIENITVTVFALDTAPFTNVSKPVTNIYSISPAAIQFNPNNVANKNLSVNIPYTEKDFPNLLDELDLKPYFSTDRESFEVFPEDSYQLDVENNIIKISTKYLGNFHLGFPKELVKEDNSDVTGVAEMVLIPEGNFEFGAPQGTKTELDETEEGLK